MIAPLLLLMQAAAPVAAAPPPQRFSIAVDPCASATDDHGKDVVVCGSPDAISPRLPLRDFRGVPDHPTPSNPDMTGIGALNGRAIGNECGAYGEGCPVGGGGYVLPKLVSGATDLVKGAFARKPNKAGRVAIDLSEQPIPANAIRP